MTRSVEWRIPVFIAIGAFALRIVLVLVFEAYIIDGEWTFGYETGRIARALAEGEGFSSPFREPSGPTAWLMPAYPALLALIFEIFGTYSVASAIAVLLFNSACGALTSVVAYLVANEAFGRPTAFVAALALALYPPSIWHSINTIWDTSLLALLALLLICGLYRLREESGLGTVAVYGLALGLAMWVNPVLLSLLPLVWWRFWRRLGGSVSRRLGAAALVTLVAAVIVSPWLLRNYQQFGRLYLRSNLGLELKLGNSEAAWRSYLEGFHVALWAFGHPSVVPEEFQRFVAMGEAAYVEEALGEALAFIRDYPERFALMSLKRVYFFWLSDLAVKNEWTGNLNITVSLAGVRMACYLVPLPFFIIGLVVAIKKGLDIEPLVGLMALFPIIYYVTHVTERYRFPVDPFIVILASYGLVWVLERVGLRVNVP